MGDSKRDPIEASRKSDLESDHLQMVFSGTMITDRKRQGPKQHSYDLAWKLRKNPAIWPQQA